MGWKPGGLVQESELGFGRKWPLLTADFRLPNFECRMQGIVWHNIMRRTDAVKNGVVQAPQK